MKKSKTLAQWRDRFKQGSLSRYNRWIILIILFLTVYLTVVFAVVPQGVSTLELGKPSPERIFAPRTVIDPYATDKLREEAAARVPEVYDYDPTVLEEVTSQLEGFFEETARLNAQDSSAEEKTLKLEQLTGFDLPAPEVTQEFFALGPETAMEIRGRVIQVTEEILRQGVKSEGVDTARRQALQGINLLPYEPEIRQVLERVVAPLIKANMFYNPEATEANRQSVRESVEPVQIQRNTLIISEGEIVTETHLKQLEALGLNSEAIPYSYYLGLFLLVLIVLGAGAVYIYRFDRDIYDDPRKLVVLAILLIVTLLLAFVINYFNPYITPVAMGPMVTAFLFNPHLAVMFALLQSVLLGVLAGEEFTLAVVALMASLAGVYVVSRLEDRNELYKVTGAIMGTSIMVYLSLLLARQGWGLEQEFLRQAGIGALAGTLSSLLATVFTMGILPYMETISGVVTTFTLVDLLKQNHPLMRRLLQEAPGTYHHSLMVGNLAEAAAEEIGVNGTLVRAAAFYHDIGKLERPLFFYENQMNIENPHQRLKPSLSRLIIASHVKDGLKLARDHNLPVPIREIISQHHGRSQISFFYRRAMEENPREYAAMEGDFRYPGPTPQTREAGLIMLADSVEAVSRVAVNANIEGIIDKVFAEKEQQLMDCPLTLRDLGKIKAAFTRVLTGRFHQRLQYPDLNSKEED